MDRTESFHRGVSVDVGAVRVTERFFQNVLPPDPLAIRAAQQFTRERLRHSITFPDKIVVVGVAGTVTTMGAIATNTGTFTPDSVNGTRLSRAWIQHTTENLLSMTIDEIESMPQVVKGREDILPGGTLVLNEFMEAFDVPEIVVSTRGLRYGLL